MEGASRGPPILQMHSQDVSRIRQSTGTGLVIVYQQAMGCEGMVKNFFSSDLRILKLHCGDGCTML